MNEKMKKKKKIEYDLLAFLWKKIKERKGDGVSE